MFHSNRCMPSNKNGSSFSSIFKTRSKEFNTKNKHQLFSTIDDITEKFNFDVRQNHDEIHVKNSTNDSSTNEIHTKTIDIASPHEGSIRVDDVLIPSQFVYIEFMGIHNSFYIGVNSIKFLNDNGCEIPYKNIMVDGQYVAAASNNTNDAVESLTNAYTENIQGPKEESEKVKKCVDDDAKFVKAAFPSQGWWTAPGDHHCLLFDLGTITHVKEVEIFCANASATPRVIAISDGYTSKTIFAINNADNDRLINDSMEEKKDEKDFNIQSPKEEMMQFHQNCFIQIGGNEVIHPSEIKFRQTPHDREGTMLSCDYIINYLNRSPPDMGFESFVSEDGHDHFVFYQHGLRSKAYQYYLGRSHSASPAETVNMANSLSIHDGVLVNDIAQRAITLKELRVIRSIILSNCMKNKWKSSLERKRIRPEDVTFNDLNHNLINPLTKRDNCSFKELFSSGPCIPTYYVSHWWGGKVLDFIQCCEYHAMMQNLKDDEAKYWVCAFAMSEHDLEIDSPLPSIQKVIEAADGVLLVADPSAVVYTRLWVAYELYTAERLKQSLDIVAFYEGNVHLLSENILRNESPWQKTRREMNFPFEHLGKVAFDFELSKADTSQQKQKIHILNAISGGDNLIKSDDLERIDIGDESNENYDDDMEKFSAVDFALRGQFALKAWSVALATEGQSVENFYGYDLSEIVMNDLDREFLVLDNVMGMKAMNDVEFERIICVLGRKVETLVINVAGCPNLTDDCLSKMHLPSSLKKLSLNFAYSEKITNFGVIDLAMKIPKNIEVLELDLCPQKLDDCSWEPPRYNEHLEVLSDCIPPTLKEFSLTTALCGNEGGSAVINLIKALPDDLTKLQINFRFWKTFAGDIAAAIAGYFPSKLQCLKFTVYGGDFFEDDDWSLFKAELLKLSNLKEIDILTTDLGQKGYYLRRELSTDDLNEISLR